MSTAFKARHQNNENINTTSFQKKDIGKQSTFENSKQQYIEECKRLLYGFKKPQPSP